MKKLLIFLALLIAHPALAAYYLRTDCGTVVGPIEGDVCSQSTTVSGRTSGHLYIYRSAAWVDVDSAGTGSPTNSTYITQTPDGTLSNEQALSTLATGIVKNTTTTGVLSIASPGTDYVTPTGSGAGLTALNASALASGTAPTARLGSGTANSSTFLRGDNTWSAVTVGSLSADGANCSAGNAPLGVDASGAVQGCFDVATQTELDTHSNLTTAHSATATNTANRIVLRDGSGNFAAGTITANLSGNVTGNASTATTATTATTANALADAGWIPPVVTVATLPASPTNGQEVTVSDASTANGCEIGGGTFRTRCVWNSTSNHWEPVAVGGSSTASSLQAAKDVGDTIANSVDTTTCVKIGNGTIFHCLFADSSNVLQNKAVNSSGTVIAVDKITQAAADKIIDLRDSSGTPVFTVTDVAGVGTITAAKGLVGGFSVPIVTGAVLLATDDAVNYVRIPYAQTITEVCAKTDTGTITVQLQRDDGSPINMLGGSPLVAASTEACTTTFVTTENVLSEGNYVDVLISSIDSGSPTRLTVSAKTTRN